MAATWKNKLYFGDNLPILRDHIRHETVDLVYIDPPFNSSRDYNVLFKEQSGQQSQAQITAFLDTWHWGPESAGTFHEIVTSGPRKLADLMQALHAFLGQNDMMAYLVMMAIRLVELHRVLKPTGSMYLHCDPTASHYLKLLMDAVFGPENFRSEIIWKRTNVHSDSKSWSAVSDTVLYYVKNHRLDFTWNPPYAPHDQAYVADKYRAKDEAGRAYTLDNMTSPNPRPNMMYEWMGFPSPPKGWRYSRETMARLHAEGRVWYPESKEQRPRLKRFLDEMPGVLMGDVWTDIAPLNSQAKERLGYPTQKPSALLERILTASSNEGDLVLDAFCGCGTTITAAERLNRQWIGIDITHLAIALMKHRLRDAFQVALRPYEVIGDPKDIHSAQAFALQDRHQFEWWAVGLVNAYPAQDRKKGADHGIDGYINFFDDDSSQAKRLLVSVKSGHVGVSMIRDLKGVLEREKAAMGVFVTLDEPTKPMLNEALAAGYYEPKFFPGKRFPRLQIVTIAELLRGKLVEYPQMGAATFKKAPKQYQDAQMQLL